MLLSTLKAVSYTHLDVYKRQGGNYARPHAGQGVLQRFRPAEYSRAGPNRRLRGATPHGEKAKRHSFPLMAVTRA